MKNELTFLLKQLHKSKTTFKNIQSQLLARKTDNLVYKENLNRIIVFCFLTIVVILTWLTIFFLNSNDTKHSILNTERGDTIEINEDQILSPCSESQIPFSQNNEILEIEDEIMIEQIEQIPIHSDRRNDISTNDSFLKDRMRLEYMQRMRVGQIYHRAYCKKLLMNNNFSLLLDI